MPGDTRRKRGGQFGNTNAFKHGIYAQPDLAPPPPHISRILDRQVAFLDQILAKIEVDLSGETTLDQNIALMRAISLSTVCTLRVLKARQFKSQEDTENFKESLDQALYELDAELDAELDHEPKPAGSAHPFLPLP